MINPKIILKALKTIGKYGPVAIDTADKIRQAIKRWKKGSPEPKLLEEGNIQVTQEDESKIEMCIKSLRQHVKVINRNSKALKEHTNIIEDITAQGEDMAILVEAMSRWIKVLIWSSGVFFIVAVIAIFVAIFK